MNYRVEFNAFNTTRQFSTVNIFKRWCVRCFHFTKNMFNIKGLIISFTKDMFNSKRLIITFTKVMFNIMGTDHHVFQIHPSVCSKILSLFAVIREKLFPCNCFINQIFRRAKNTFSAKIAQRLNQIVVRLNLLSTIL